jgi:hypothetical protein
VRFSQEVESARIGKIPVGVNRQVHRGEENLQVFLIGEEEGSIFHISFPRLTSKNAQHNENS